MNTEFKQVSVDDELPAEAGTYIVITHSTVSNKRTALFAKFTNQNNNPKWHINTTYREIAFWLKEKTYTKSK